MLCGRLPRFCFFAVFCWFGFRRYRVRLKGSTSPNPSPICFYTFLFFFCISVGGFRVRSGLKGPNSPNPFPWFSFFLIASERVSERTSESLWRISENLWKLSENLSALKSLKISENLFKPLATSENLWKPSENPSLSETLSEADFPLRGSRSCCPYFLLPLKLPPTQIGLRHLNIISSFLCWPHEDKTRVSL